MGAVWSKENTQWGLTVRKRPGVGFEIFVVSCSNAVEIILRLFTQQDETGCGGNF